MYPSSSINQYNSYQYNAQPPGTVNVSQLQQSQNYNQQSHQQQQYAPPIPNRGVSGPNDPTQSVIAKALVSYAGINPNPNPPSHEKIRFATTNLERMPFERKADLYAIIVGLEHLESAFLRDAVGATQYTTSCNRFLSQYKTWQDVHNNLIQSAEHFCRESGLSCPAALNRIKAGLPATAVHGGHEASSDTGGLMTVDLAEKFITTHDIARMALAMPDPKLEVENIYSYLSDLLDSLAKYPNLPSDHEIKLKIQLWVKFCAAKPNCYYEFTLEELRQLAFDLENAYSSFRKFVGKK